MPCSRQWRSSRSTTPWPYPTGVCVRGTSSGPPFLMSGSNRTPCSSSHEIAVGAAFSEAADQRRLQAELVDEQVLVEQVLCAVLQPSLSLGFRVRRHHPARDRRVCVTDDRFRLGDRHPSTLGARRERSRQPRGARTDNDYVNVSSHPCSFLLAGAVAPVANPSTVPP